MSNQGVADSDAVGQRNARYPYLKYTQLNRREGSVAEHANTAPNAKVHGISTLVAAAPRLLLVLAPEGFFILLTRFGRVFDQMALL